MNGHTSDHRPETEPMASAACPRHKVPTESIVAIEHPCIIKNVDKGLKSLGGSVALERFLQNKDRSKFIGASLRPDDPLAKPLASQPVRTQNLLLKVTVPKRTGRKRKRGSTDPYEGPEGVINTKNAFVEATTVRQILRDNSSSYAVEPVGVIEETHRFRGLPDFQYAASTDPLMVHIRDTILSGDYEKLKDFKINSDRNNRSAGIGPPAIFTFENVPTTYSYRQNPAIQFVERDGEIVAVNTQLPGKPLMQIANLEVEDVPAGPSVPLEPEESLPSELQQTIARARAALEERPIMTRRALRNVTKTKLDFHVRSAYPYLGYSFVKGPFRDTLIKYGVDPRSNPKYRQYQSLVFQLTPSAGNRDSSDDEDEVERVEPMQRPRGPQISTNGHIFDGKKFDSSSKVWQLCDVTDPLLQSIVETEELRTSCDIKATGWYHNGTWAKLKVIMKHKITLITNGSVPDDAKYAELLKFPNEATDANMPEVPHGRKKRTLPDDISALVSEVRALARMNFPIQKGKQRQVESPEASALPAEDDIVMVDDSSDDANTATDEGEVDGSEEMENAESEADLTR